MKNLRLYISRALEVLLIAAVIVGIVAGLELIGIFSFSELLPWYDGDDSENNNVLLYDDDNIYKALSEGKSTDTVSVISDLSREHVIKLLEEVSTADDYYQELNVTVCEENGKVFASKATVSYNNGEYDVSLFSSGGNIYKRIVEKEDKVQLSFYDNAGKESKTTLEKGGFDIRSDTGIIMTHDRFFSEYSSYAPETEFYSVAYSDFGSVLFFEFETKLSDYTQLERYWLSLDYGVVTKAECYEGENLIYLLETTALNSGI